MAPHRKKKKPASNPARGFTTVSIPSKSQSTSTEALPKPDILPTGVEAESTVAQPENRQAETSLAELSPEELEKHLEEAELQSFLDKYAGKCKSEASRQAGKLETERRTLRAQGVGLDTRDWLTPDIRDMILEKETKEVEKLPSFFKFDENFNSMANEEDLCMNLWTLKQTLLKLGFSEHQVDEALGGILLHCSSDAASSKDFAWGVYQAFEWLALHSANDELPPYDQSKTPARMGAQIDENEVPPPDSGSSTPVRRRTRKSPTNFSAQATFESEASDTDLDPENLIPRFIELRSRIYYLNPSFFNPFRANSKRVNSSITDPTINAQIEKLKSKLSLVEKDILFDPEVAEARWKDKLSELRSQTSEALRRGLGAAEHQPEALLIRDGEAAVTIVPSDKSPEPTLFDSDNDDGILGDMFTADTTTLEATPADKPGSESATVKIRDFGKPLGISPRRILEETCRSRDPGFKLFYRDLSCTPYSHRKSIEIFWSKTQEAPPKFPLQDVSYSFSSRSLKASMDSIKNQADEDVVLVENFKRRNGDARSNAEESPQRKGAGFLTSAQYCQSLWTDRSSTTSFKQMMIARKTLPIWPFKEEILETLLTNRTLIICSETGSGKSTQIPSFILENELTAGRPCKIFATEPRRISAISLAKRVSEELGEPKDAVGTKRSLVGYAIRLESKVTTSTRLVYATTGVVIRMLEKPEEFKDITHLVLDEVHERTIDSDFLLIIIRRLLSQREDLKLILMSATVDAKRLSAYLDGAPVLNIPGRTFAVQTNYLEDAIELTRHYSHKKEPLDYTDDSESSDVEEVRIDEGVRSTLAGYSKQTRDAVCSFDEYRLDYKLILDLIYAIATKPELERYSKAVLVFMPGLAEIRRLHDSILSESFFGDGWIVHSLHSSIASEDQERAFLIPPKGMRKIVIATNIAETDSTSDDKYPGSSKRLYLAPMPNNAELAEQQTPEMLRLSLQDLILRVKICNLGDTEETLSEALDPPSSKNIRRAIEALKAVKALTGAETLTPLGKQLAQLPLDVFLGKLILYGALFQCVDATVSIAAILSCKSPFVHAGASNDQTQAAKRTFGRGNSDLLSVYNAYSAWSRCRSAPGMNEFAFCRKNCLSPQALLNIEDVKTQLLVSLVDTGLVKLDVSEQAALNRARFSGRKRQFFTVPDRLDINSSNDLVMDAVIAWSFYPRILTRQGKGWRNISNNQSVVLHATSVNKNADASIKWLSYYHIMQSRNRNYNAHETSAVEDFCIALLCGDADFKIYSGVVSIDGNRIRFSMKDWKTMIALKALSTRIRDVLAQIFRLGFAVEWFENRTPYRALKDDSIDRALNRQNPKTFQLLATSKVPDHHGASPDYGLILSV
ncbi:conserved hypothetical protein [Uncinocarpus reesii 1704]|uniref:RNA helicase n=1 Tax=Uncinocarpus reesii (strain UAMH 1704) TaxID=336963 RepID=C4JEW0_UNCRE|nr:uncharacterized protein UREG_00860 [Uncinocarpus reesii 1704]EEP76013.1 conserved hypothetical protein [Uncinocarpus reesii 1704]